MTEIPVITIDGPSGSGKGTLCKAIARILKWNILDSGIIYRALALTALYHNVDLSFIKNHSLEKELTLLATHLDIHFIFKKDNLEVILEGENISNKICTQEIAIKASLVAVFPRVRMALLHRQRAFRELPGLIADGRDMGTVVFPDAQVKFFLDASPEKRAHRRMLQLKRRNFNVNFECLLSEMKERDYRDRNRSIAPLVPAEDALIVDSANLNIKQLIEKTLQYARQKLAIL